MTEEEKKAYVADRILRAQESLVQTDLLYDNQHYNAAASRLYYAAFYAASALLVLRDLSIKTHAGVRNELNRHFVKTGVIDRQQGRLFANLFDLRQLGDYGELHEVDQAALDVIYLEGKALVEHLVKLSEDRT